ncbi:Queuosine Biosynthesis QueE Radical SAM [Chitinispirillum alkaliphilum]|nr:Queuosine Biosynthesis QueE Radical SAM [Chitinispirillum alkaliphilum]
MEVIEIFKSIQGESSYSGRLCSFVRLKGCNLNCVWCDTEYAVNENGTVLDVGEIVSLVKQHHTKLVEITGGEPLLQDSTPRLCSEFLDRGYTVLVETNGSLDIGKLPSGVLRIIDIKCPDSGEGLSFRMDNLDLLTKQDECKFVVASVKDLNWASSFIKKHDLTSRCTLFLSPAGGLIGSCEVADFIVENSMDVRLGVQLHKLIWGERRGV